MSRRLLRRLVPVGVTVLALTGADRPALAAPLTLGTREGPSQAGAGYAEVAGASWIVLLNEFEGLFYVAEVQRTVSPGGVDTTALVGVGTCVIERRESYEITLCSAEAKAHPVDPQGFELDPLLRSAHLRLDDGTVTADVTWEGEGSLPAAHQESLVSEFGAGLAAAFDRPASAAGTVAGRKLEPTPQTLLFRAAGAFVGLEPGAVRRVELVVRTPRR